MRERVAGASLRQVAAEVGVSHNAVHKLLKGETPYERTLDKFERWAEGLAEGVGLALNADVDAPQPDYDSLLGSTPPGYERLLPEPRATFDRFMWHLMGRGVGREDLIEVARFIVGPLSSLDALYQDQDDHEAHLVEGQKLLVERSIPTVRELLRAKGYNV